MLVGLLVAVERACEAAAPAPLTGSLERKVKAAYLFNFAKYLDWPAGAFPSAQAPIIIGILGQDPFGQIIEQTIAKRRVGPRPVVLQRGKQVTELTNCHILFIASSEKDGLSKVLATLKGKHALTVSEIPQFCSNGGMLTFVIDHEVVRFEINLDNAEEAGLKISARMLTTAKAVHSRKRSQPP
jgi:hypothetical protein